jgi:hypothetical protein
MAYGFQAQALSFIDATTLTIASGAVTLAQSSQIIESETGTTDDLDTINVISSVDLTYNTIIYIKAKATHTITLKHQTGNIYIPGGGDVTLTENNVAVLLYNGTNWDLINAVGQAQTYTVTNGSTDRTFDADTVVVAELADIVYTLLVDLASAGIIKQA